MQGLTKSPLLSVPCKAGGVAVFFGVPAADAAAAAATATAAVAATAAAAAEMAADTADEVTDRGEFSPMHEPDVCAVSNGALLTSASASGMAIEADVPALGVMARTSASANGRVTAGAVGCNSARAVVFASAIATLRSGSPSSGTDGVWISADGSCGASGNCAA